MNWVKKVDNTEVIIDSVKQSGIIPHCHRSTLMNEE